VLTTHSYLAVAFFICTVIPQVTSLPPLHVTVRPLPVFTKSNRKYAAYTLPHLRHAVVVLVEVLYYKLEGRGYIADDANGIFH